MVLSAILLPAFSLNVAAGGTGNIVGEVTDANGNLIPFFPVMLSNGWSIKTDSNGSFEFSDVTDGTYTVTAGDLVSKNVTVTAGQTTDVGTIEITSPEPLSYIAVLMIPLAILMVIVAVMLLLVLLVHWISGREKIN